MRGRVSAVNGRCSSARSNQLGEFRAGAMARHGSAPMPAVLVGGVGTLLVGADLDEASRLSARRHVDRLPRPNELTLSAGSAAPCWPAWFRPPSFAVVEEIRQPALGTPWS